MARKHKVVTVETDLAGALAAGSDVEELKDEMESWRDNMADRFSSTEKYDRVDEAANALADLDADRKVDDLVDALGLAADGKAEVPGCPQHVPGRKCRRCRWNGKEKTRGRVRKIVRHDPPLVEESMTETTLNGSDKGKVRTYRIEIYATVDGSERYSSLVGHTRATTERRLAAIERENEWNAILVVPERLPAEPGVPSIPEFAGIMEVAVSYSSFRKSRMSRADRAGLAAAALGAAVEVVKGRCLSVKEVLEARLLADMSAPTVRADRDALRRVGEIEDLADEVEQVCTELADVDFPGMYG